MLSVPGIGKALNRANLALAIMTPQTYEIAVEPGGLVNLPSSQWLFRTNRTIESLLDGLNLHNLRLKATARGIGQAAEKKQVIHLWAHPHEFRTEKDFEKLGYVFGYVAEEVGKGRLESLTMAALATHAVEQ